MFFLVFRWNNAVNYFPQRTWVALIGLDLLISVCPFRINKDSFDVITGELVSCPVGSVARLKETTMKAISSFHEFFNIISHEWARTIADLDGFNWGVYVKYLTENIVESVKLDVYIRTIEH